MVLTAAAVGEAVEQSTPELARRDAEAEGLCHQMTERLKLLHDERAVLSADVRELSARRPSVRLIPADNALAAMAAAGVAGLFAGAALARFMVARKKRPRQATTSDQAGQRPLVTVSEGKDGNKVTEKHAPST